MWVRIKMYHQLCHNDRTVATGKRFTRGTSNSPVEFTESRHMYDGSRGPTAARQLIRFLGRGPVNLPARCVTASSWQSSITSKNGRATSRGGHNGDGGVIFGHKRPGWTARSSDMRSMSDASSRCAGHVTKDPVVSDLPETIRIIRRHATRRRGVSMSTPSPWSLSNNSDGICPPIIFYP